MGAVSSISAGATMIARQRREPKRETRELYSCERGEHLHVTGRRTCPLCGAEL